MNVWVIKAEQVSQGGVFRVGQVLSDSEASCFDCLSFLATPPKHILLSHFFNCYLFVSTFLFVLFILQGSGGPYQGEQ